MLTILRLVLIAYLVSALVRAVRRAVQRSSSQESLRDTLQDGFDALFGFRPYRSAASQRIFLRSFFSLLAKMARADGAVDTAEILAVERIIHERLGLREEQRQFAIAVFREAKMSPTPFSDYAREFYQHFRRYPGVLALMLEGLRTVALSDGRVTAEEEELLFEAAQIFGFHFRSSSHTNRTHQDTSTAQEGSTTRSFKSYQTLGVSPDATVAEIKRAYRRRVKEFHPDSQKRSGVPPEFMKMAEAKFREVQEAYEKIQAERGF